MVVARDGLGRAARKRGIEGQITTTRHFGIRCMADIKRIIASNCKQQTKSNDIVKAYNMISETGKLRNNAETVFKDPFSHTIMHRVFFVLIRDRWQRRAECEPSVSVFIRSISRANSYIVGEIDAKSEISVDIFMAAVDLTLDLGARPASQERPRDSNTERIHLMTTRKNITVGPCSFLFLTISHKRSCMHTFIWQSRSWYLL